MVWNNIEDASTLKLVNLIVTCFSLTGSTLMGFFCLRMRPRTVQIKLILSIAISDLFFSIANLMSNFEGDSVTPLCYAEATLRAFSFVLSICFTTGIGILCYQTADVENTVNEERFFNRTAVIGICFCIFLVLAPMFIPPIQYANSTTYCLITYASGSSLATMLLIRMLYEGFPILAGLTVSLAAYIGTVRRLKQYTPVFKETHLNKLFWYPFVLFVLFVPSLMDNFTFIFLNEDEPIVLKFIHLSTTHLIGLVNALLYGVQVKLNHLEPSDMDKSRLSGTSELVKGSSSNLDNILLGAAGEG